MAINRITDDFDTFVKKITINEKEKQDIIDKHNNLSKMLMEDTPEGYEIDRINLSGSYAKHTVLNEQDKDKLPDVDMIVILKKSSTSSKTNKDFLDYFINKKGKVTQNIRQQSNSIGLIYSGISVDIVLAKEENGKLFIASNKEGNWIESNALVHVEYMKKQQKKYEINYHSLMKLFKYLNKYVLNNKIKSYTLEMLVHQAVPKYKVDQTLPEVFKDTLGNIVSIKTINDIRDCSDSTKCGYDKKDEGRFNNFQKELEQLYNLAISACNGCRKDWEKIFGEDFPKQPYIKVENNNSYKKNQTPWCSYE